MIASWPENDLLAVRRFLDGDRHERILLVSEAIGHSVELADLVKLLEPPRNYANELAAIAEMAITLKPSFTSHIPLLHPPPDKRVPHWLRKQNTPFYLRFQKRRHRPR